LRKVWAYLPIVVVPESFNFDLFISYSRHDNREGYISEFVARIQKGYRDFTGGRELRIFFEKDEIDGYDRQRCWSPSKSGGCHGLNGCISLPPRGWMSTSCSAGKGTVPS